MLFRERWNYRGGALLATRVHTGNVAATTPVPVPPSDAVSLETDATPHLTRPELDVGR